MKFKLIKENLHEIYGILYGLISLIFMYVIFVAGVLGLIFFALWNLGIAPVLEIAKIDILSSSLATLSIFSTFCFFHIDILKDNKRRYNTLRYLKYNLWLSIVLKIFIYLFASIPFIILWNYTIPNIFVLNLPKINFLQSILFIVSIRFIFGIIFYSIAKEVTSNSIVNNIGEFFIEIFNSMYPEGTYVICNAFLNEKAGDLEYIENYCKDKKLAYRLGSTETEYVAILCNKQRKPVLNQINAIVFEDEKDSSDWFKFFDLEEEDLKDLDIIEFNIYISDRVLI